MFINRLIGFFFFFFFFFFTYEPLLEKINCLGLSIRFDVILAVQHLLVTRSLTFCIINTHLLLLFLYVQIVGFLMWWLI